MQGLSEALKEVIKVYTGYISHSYKSYYCAEAQDKSGIQASDKKYIKEVKTQRERECMCACVTE